VIDEVHLKEFVDRRAGFFGQTFDRRFGQL
jgi:hypothetical protein